MVGFGLDGKAIAAEDAGRGKGSKLLVIKPEGEGGGWREAIRRKRGGRLPAEAQAEENGKGGEARDVVEVSTVGGLTIAESRVVDGEGDTAMMTAETGTEGQKGADTKPLTADEEAVAALLGEKKKSGLTIPAAATSTDLEMEDSGGLGLEGPGNEAERFRADVESRPLPASLAEYNAVPVEEFGAALLRGLGWKEGEGVGRRRQAASTTATAAGATAAGATASTAVVKPREVKRRPALLGLGAKETPGGVSGEELGAWNHKKGKPGGGGKVGYQPLMLRNRETGEMVTEEEMELRKVEAKQGRKSGGKGGERDWRDRREGKVGGEEGRGGGGRLAIQNGDGDGRGESGAKRRDRSKDRERDNDRRRDREHGSSRRERSRSWERSKDKSSRKERDRSKEREHRRKDDDYYNRRHRDTGSKRRDEDREYDRRTRDKDYDDRDRSRKHKRH